ncbi:hypothetical protein ACFQY0_21105 [Haloferula chungangensis]|uniref:Lipoprotein n=1 Tax=Haloferula chungangensis TaxID=1048331 RepID=A0ABW2LB67_9BACT
MAVELLFTQALGLTSTWKVVSPDFDPEARSLELVIDFKPGSRFVQKMLKFYAASVGVALLGTSCSHHPAVEDSGPPLSSLSPPFIVDREPLADETFPSLEDLALTLPVFETSPTRVADDDGTRYENGGRTWTIEADGAQVPVRVDRLTPEKVAPTRILVTLGPKPLYGIDEIWIYELERVPGGWRRLSAKTKAGEQADHDDA